LKEVQRLCQYKEFWVAFKTRALSPEIWAPKAFKRLGDDISIVIKQVLTLWYSLFWGTMEDTGIAIGYLTSLVLDFHIDDVVPNLATDQTWDCSIWAPYSYFSEVTDYEYSIKKWWN
jgi:hypothetical protein